MVGQTAQVGVLIKRRPVPPCRARQSLDQIGAANAGFATEPSLSIIRSRPRSPLRSSSSILERTIRAFSPAGKALCMARISRGVRHRSHRYEYGAYLTKTRRGTDPRRTRGSPRPQDARHRIFVRCCASVFFPTIRQPSLNSNAGRQIGDRTVRADSEDRLGFTSGLEERYRHARMLGHSAGGVLHTGFDPRPATDCSGTFTLAHCRLCPGGLAAHCSPWRLAPGQHPLTAQRIDNQNE